MPKRLETRVNKLESKNEADSLTSVVPIVNKTSEMLQRGEPMEPTHPDLVILLRNRMRRECGSPLLTEEEELSVRTSYDKYITRHLEEMPRYQARREQILSLSKDGLTIDEITRTLRDKGDSIPESQIRAIIAEENTDAKHSNENR